MAEADRELGGGGSVPEAHHDEIENMNSHGTVPPFGVKGDEIANTHDYSRCAGNVNP